MFSILAISHTCNRLTKYHRFYWFFFIWDVTWTSQSLSIIHACTATIKWKDPFHATEQYFFNSSSDLLNVFFRTKSSVLLTNVINSVLLKKKYKLCSFRTLSKSFYLTDLLKIVFIYLTKLTNIKNKIELRYSKLLNFFYQHLFEASFPICFYLWNRKI